jgi:chromosome segregation ATPase
MIEALQRDVGQWRAERDHATAQWEECCEDRSRQVTALREQLVEMTAERDTMDRYLGQMRDSRDVARKATADVEQDLVKMTAERDAARKFADKLQVDLGYCRCEHDAAREGLAQAKEAADMFAAENTSLQDTVRQLRAKQIHDDLPGILMVIQLAAEQARELI